MSRELSPTGDVTPRPITRHLSDPFVAHASSSNLHPHFALPLPTPTRQVQTAPSTPHRPPTSSMLNHRRHGSTSTLRSNPSRSRADSVIAFAAAGAAARASTHSLSDTDGMGLTAVQMAALVEIQRVLYHGGRGLARKGKAKEYQFVIENDEVAEIVQKFLDPDCAYESPFVTLPTRPLVASFFHLCSILSQILLPSLTPVGLLRHLKNATLLSEQEQDPAAWWKAWEVWGECGEIGGMECFDGFHLGLIDQTLNIHFLPHLLPESLQPIPPSPSPTFEPQPIYAKVPPLPRSLLTKAMTHMLRFELRIVTVVEFNENGKISYLRDLLDLREVFEAVVPFGRAIGWVTRRVTGLAAVGVSMALHSFRSPPPVIRDKAETRQQWPPKDDEEWAGWQTKMSEALDVKRAESGETLGLSRTSSRVSDDAVHFDSSKVKIKKVPSPENQLGLTGNEDCAPDVDHSAL